MTRITGVIIDEISVKIRGQVCQKKWPRGQKIWPEMVNWSEKWLQI